MKVKLCQKANATNIHSKTGTLNKIYVSLHFNRSSNVFAILFMTNKQIDDGAFSYYNFIYHENMIM